MNPFTLCVFAVAVTVATGVVHAQPPLDLYRVWQQGFSYDANYKAAVSRFSSSQEQEKISRGGLLPQVNAGYSRSRIHGWRQQPGYFGQMQRSDLRYDSTNIYAQLNQPLFNYPRYAEYRRGQAVARFGVAQFGVDKQQISLRIAQAYFATVLAFEDEQTQQKRVTFLERRVQSFEQLLKYADATQLDLTETQARLDTARADLLKANDELRISARQLQSHIGIPPHALYALNTNWYYQPLDQSERAGVTPFLERALLQNKDIQAAKQQVAVYQARLEAARSQYFPTIDLGLSVGKADSEDLSTLSQRSNTFAIGINVNIPIFTGGYTTAAISQARFQMQAAQYRYNATVAAVQAEVQKQYNLYTSGQQRVSALRNAMDSSQLSLDSVEKSFSVGAASNLEVLDAQDQFVQTRYDYYYARLELLLAQLRLHAALGDDLHQTVQQQSKRQFQGEVIELER